MDVTRQANNVRTWLQIAVHAAAAVQHVQHLHRGRTREFEQARCARRCARKQSKAVLTGARAAAAQVCTSRSWGNITAARCARESVAAQHGTAKDSQTVWQGRTSASDSTIVLTSKKPRSRAPHSCTRATTVRVST